MSLWATSYGHPTAGQSHLRWFALHLEVGAVAAKDHPIPGPRSSDLPVPADDCSAQRLGPGPDDSFFDRDGWSKVPRARSADLRANHAAKLF